MLRFFSVLLLVVNFTSLSAQAPPANPTNMQFSAIRPYAFQLIFTPSTADGFLVLKGTSPITDEPADGIVYEKGQGLSGCKVMAVGNVSGFNVREVIENTTYHFSVFAYNGTGANIKYQRINPLVGSITTPAVNPGNYYANIDSNSGTLLADLKNLINPHTLVAYTQYRNNVVPTIFERDTIGSQSVVNCEYSGFTKIFTPPFDFTIPPLFSREHSLAKSWMQTGGNTNTAEGADYHNLLLTELNNVNSKRSNNPLGIVVTPTYTYLGCKLGLNSQGQTVFEPINERKGDVARAMFYQMVCYNGLSGNWGFDFLPSQATEQDQAVLKLWHQQDPPDKFERTKSDYIASIQFNRNPFVDHPGWVNCINFDSLVKTTFCGAVSSLSEAGESIEFSVFPNPSSSELNVVLPDYLNEAVQFTVYNIVGQEMINITLLNSSTKVDISNLKSSNYVVRVNVDNRQSYKRIAVLN